MRCTEIKGTQNYFVLFLCTQAGTYIKEFVHGDLGRTFPKYATQFSRLAKAVMWHLYCGVNPGL
jgi:tRNA U54 and U55 pseudouridine synthase Pus10